MRSFLHQFDNRFKSFYFRMLQGNIFLFASSTYFSMVVRGRVRSCIALGD